MKRFWQAFVAAVLLVGPLSIAPARADELIMFEQQGCPYCAAWEHDIGRIYPNTDEAKALPLRRVDIHTARPPELRTIKGVRYTPTFVVLHCGREAQRIVGYAGQEQFWELLDSALKHLDACPKSVSVIELHGS